MEKSICKGTVCDLIQLSIDTSLEQAQVNRDQQNLVIQSRLLVGAAVRGREESQQSQAMKKQP